MASTTRKFTAGSSILATYTVPNIPGTTQVSSGAELVADTNLNPQNNVVTITGAPLTLPVAPKVYYIGVVIDPFPPARRTSRAVRAPQLAAMATRSASRG